MTRIITLFGTVLFALVAHVAGEDLHEDSPTGTARFMISGAGAFRVQEPSTASVDSKSTACEKLRSAKVTLCPELSESTILTGARSPVCASLMRAYINGCAPVNAGQLGAGNSEVNNTVQAQTINSTADEQTTEDERGQQTTDVDEASEGKEKADSKNTVTKGALNSTAHEQVDENLNHGNDTKIDDMGKSEGEQLLEKMQKQDAANANNSLSTMAMQSSMSSTNTSDGKDRKKTKIAHSQNCKKHDPKCELQRLQHEARDLSIQHIKEEAAARARHRKEMNELYKEQLELTSLHREVKTTLMSPDLRNRLSPPLTRAVSATIGAQKASADAISSALAMLPRTPVQQVPERVAKMAAKVKAETINAVTDEKRQDKLQAKVGRQELREVTVGVKSAQAKVDRRKVNAEAKEIEATKKKLSKTAYAAVVATLDDAKKKAALETKEAQQAKLKADKKQASFARLKREAKAQKEETKKVLKEAKENSQKAEDMTEDVPTKQLDVLPPPFVKPLPPSLNPLAVEDEDGKGDGDLREGSANKEDPMRSPQQPIEGERPTYDEAKDQMAPASSLDTTLIAGSPDLCMSNIPQDERNQCDKLFKEREIKGQGRCSGQVKANGKDYPVEKACARSCSKERAVKKVKKKHDAIMKEDREKMASKRKVEATQVEEEEALYAKLNKAKGKIRALRKSKTVALNPDGPTPAILKQIKEHEKDATKFEAEIKELEKLQSQTQESILKIQDSLNDKGYLHGQEEAAEVLKAVHGLKDHFELDFPIAAFEKKGLAREEAHLPVRDDGVGRLMRFNRLLAGKRLPHLLFIDEHTRVLFQIDATSGRVVQLVDFWKLGYLHKYGKRHGTPDAQRLPCPVQYRLKDDYYQDGLTQKSYTHQKGERCLAMNPHVVSYKRRTMTGKGTNQDLSHEPHFLYNDIAEFELGFAFTGVAIPNDRPKPGPGSQLEPHHNTWRVPDAQEDDSMYFYAAQGMILSSMQFIHKNNNYGWQRHNHPRIELLEYQVDTPTQNIRTFPVLGIPDFFPNLPGPEELDGQKNEDWSSPIGKHIQNTVGREGSFYEGQLAKVMRWLKQERYDQIMMERRMSCGKKSSPHPWHVIQAQHDCNQQVVLDQFSQFNYPTEYVDCKQIVCPACNPGCWSSRHENGRDDDDDIIWWHRTRCAPPLPLCSARPGTYTVYERTREHNLGSSRKMLRKAKQRVKRTGPLASVCPFSCTEEKQHKSYNKYFPDTLHSPSDQMPGYILPNQSADKIRSKRLAELIMKRDGRGPTSSESSAIAAGNAAIAGKHGGELNAQRDEIRVMGPRGGQYPKSSNRARSHHAFFNYGFNIIANKFYTCLNELKVAAKADSAKYDEMGRVMHSFTWNTEYLPPGTNMPLSVWKKCQKKVAKKSLPTLKNPWKSPNYPGFTSLGDSNDANDPDAKKKEKRKKKAKELFDKKVKAEKKRRARLVKDAIVKQQIMAEIDAGKAKEIRKKSKIFYAAKDKEVKEKKELMDCSLAEELPMIKKCYKIMEDAIKKPSSKFHFYGIAKRDTPNLSDATFVPDFIAAHEKCVASRTNYRHWECQRMFALDGPGAQCRKKDSADCEKKGDCGRRWDCASNQKYKVKREWKDGDDDVSDQSGSHSCTAACGTISSQYPHGAEAEGYVHYIPRTGPRVRGSPGGNYLPNNPYNQDIRREDIPSRMIGYNPGGPENRNEEYTDESVKYWTTVNRARMKLQLLGDNIKRAEKGIIYENLWMPYHLTRDTRGIKTNWYLQGLRKVSVLESLAIPRPDGSFTRQIWLATAGMSFFGATAQGEEEEDVATWGGTGMGECPPYGVESRLYVAEVPHFSECPYRCEMHFRDIGFAPATHFSVAPDKNNIVFKRNPDILDKFQKRYSETTKNWKNIMRIPAQRKHDDSPFMLLKHSDKHRNGFYGGSGRRRCYGGKSYRKVMICAMTFDVVSAVEKHVFFMDTCGRIISAVIVGELGHERMIEQQELAGVKCRERMLHGGQSFDGKGTNAAFAPYFGRFYSGSGMIIMTDRTTLQKYMVVADGWKSKVRTVKLGKIRAVPTHEERVELGSSSTAPKHKDCPMEKGFCLSSSGTDQNDGVARLFRNDIDNKKSYAACLAACSSRPGVTGCEGIANQENRGCYAHTKPVSKGNGQANHVCWVFSKCSDAEAAREYVHPWTTPRPVASTAIVATPDPFPAPRKLSAGEHENMYVVSNFALIYDVDLRPTLPCDEARKVFPAVMRDNPPNYWKHHFGFDKWLPDRKDDTPEICETTDECRGNTAGFEPVCKCAESYKIAKTVCARTHEWDTCSKNACKKTGTGCKPAGLRGKEKQEWALQWWRQLNNEQRINYHGGWEHFPIQKMKRTLRYCLERKMAKDMSVIEPITENTSPEKLHKEVEKKASEYKERQKEVGKHCGVKYGSWWQIALFKQVQMIRYMCGPKGAPGDDCPVVYMTKVVLCSEQIIGGVNNVHNITAMKEVREPLPPQCCTDKVLTRWLSPRLGGPNPNEPDLKLPRDLHEQALAKLELF